MPYHSTKQLHINFEIMLPFPHKNARRAAKTYQSLADWNIHADGIYTLVYIGLRQLSVTHLLYKSKCTDSQQYIANTAPGLDICNLSVIKISQGRLHSHHTQNSGAIAVRLRISQPRHKARYNTIVALYIRIGFYGS